MVGTVLKLCQVQFSRLDWCRGCSSVPTVSPVSVFMKNSVLFTAYRTRTEPIPGTAAELLAPAQIDNTQTGASVVWSHQLTPLYTLATSADWSRAVANDASGRRTEQATLQILLSAPISVLTTIVTGIRHQRITSNLEADIRETEVFVGMNHLFR